MATWVHFSMCNKIWKGSKHYWTDKHLSGKSEHLKNSSIWQLGSHFVSRSPLLPTLLWRHLCRQGVNQNLKKKTSRECWGGRLVGLNNISPLFESQSIGAMGPRCNNIIQSSSLSVNGYFITCFGGSGVWKRGICGRNVWNVYWISKTNAMHVHIIKPVQMVGTQSNWNSNLKIPQNIFWQLSACCE